MDFFASQDQARTRTTVLVVCFFLAVLLIIAAVYLVFAAFLLNTTREMPTDGDVPGWWNPELFLGVSVGTALVVLAGSLYKTAALRSGGAAVARMLGGKPVSPDTVDLNQRRLLNVVEEMAIASGTPVPPVYLLPNERGINAFAAGFSPSDAVVGVTQGCIETLTRDELQGVIAHEFSHILRGDMRLNVRLIGVLHGILLISIIGYILMRTSGSSRSYFSKKKGGNPLPLIGLGLYIVGYIGVFFGKIIKSAVSRQREFLADASAVQFTRNPGGLGGALKKIGGRAFGSRIQNAEAEEASHMFFGNGVKQSFLGLLSTHPPLVERIRRIEPNFDGKFPQVTAESVAAERAAEQLTEISASSLAGAAAPAAVMAFGPAEIAVHVGSPTPRHLAFASELLASLPPALKTLAHEPHGARPLVYALLLDSDPAIRKKQFAAIGSTKEAATISDVNRILPEVAKLDPAARLPLVELTLPALRNLSKPQFEQFEATIHHLIAADEQVDLFEYALKRMVLRHLGPQFKGHKPAAVRYHAISALREPIVTLLSALSYAGHGEPAGARRAFDAAAAQCFEPRSGVVIRPRDAAGLADLDQSLELLAQASPQIKKRVLSAAVVGIGTDGQISLAEGELLRAIADSLDCPMPPLLT